MLYPCKVINYLVLFIIDVYINSERTSLIQDHSRHAYRGFLARKESFKIPRKT